MINCSLLSPYTKVLKKIIHKIIFFSLILLMTNCGEEPIFLGRNLLPATDNISVKVDSVTTIVAFTVNAKPIITSSNEQFILGSLNDSIFGYSEATIISQIDAVSPRTLPATRFIDSLIVSLKVKGHFGDSLDVQTLRVYEITKDIKMDTSYFSNTDPDTLYSPIELGSVEFLPADSIITLKVTDLAYLERFRLIPDTMFSKMNYLRDFFKGLYFEVDKKTEYGGALAYLDFTSQQTNMTLYYDSVQVVGDTTNLSFVMNFGFYSSAFNIFKSDYTNYPPAAGLNNPETEDTVLFATSMAGIDVRLFLPDLERWRALAPVSIIKAELIIGVEDVLYQYNDSTNYPSRFILYSVNLENNYDILYDYRLDSNIFGGFYNKDEKAYKINISYHLQSYIDGRIDKTELALITINNNSTANRVLLKSPLASGKGRMKLRVIYAEV